MKTRQSLVSNSSTSSFITNVYSGFKPRENRRYTVNSVYNALDDLIWFCRRHMYCWSNDYSTDQIIEDIGPASKDNLSLMQSCNGEPEESGIPDKSDEWLKEQVYVEFQSDWFPRAWITMIEELFNTEVYRLY